MYRDKKGDIVVEEDEQIYGEDLEIVDKKVPLKRVPYTDLFS